MLIQLLRRYLPASLYLHARTHYNRRKRSVSQAGQDFWVFGEVFNEMRNGYFVDVGAADGMYLSNTFLLEQRYGWDGICIEANPIFFAQLQRVRAVKCVRAAVDADERDVEFVVRGVVGGIVDATSDNRTGAAESQRSQTIMLRTRTLASILEAENAPRTIDYLSMDVEGVEERVLATFPFDAYTVNSLTVERPKPPLRDLLNRHGYILVKEMPDLDAFYVHESFRDRYRQNMYAFWEKQAR